MEFTHSFANENDVTISPSKKISLAYPIRECENIDEVLVLCVREKRSANKLRKVL